MFDIASFAGYIGATGQALIDLDADKVGGEDFAGALFVYTADVLTAAKDGSDLPEFPEALKAGTTDKIKGGFRATLIVANSVLGFARFQVTGKAAVALKYANQAISQLLAGQGVPPAPSALLK